MSTEENVERLRAIRQRMMEIILDKELKRKHSSMYALYRNTMSLNMPYAKLDKELMELSRLQALADIEALTGEKGGRSGLDLQALSTMYYGRNQALKLRHILTPLSYRREMLGRKQADYIRDIRIAEKQLRELEEERLRELEEELEMMRGVDGAAQEGAGVVNPPHAGAGREEPEPEHTDVGASDEKYDSEEEERRALPAGVRGLDVYDVGPSRSRDRIPAIKKEFGQTPPNYYKKK